MKTHVINVNSILKLPGAKIRILRFYNYQCKPDAPKHAHHYYELHYITKGSTIFYIDFRNTVTVNSGEWLLLGPDIYHEEKNPTESSGICFGFEIQNVEPKTSAFLLSNEQYYKHSDEENSVIETILKLIVNEFSQAKENYDIICRELFLILLLHVQRQYKEKENDHNIVETVMDKEKNIMYIIDLFFNQIFDFGKMDLTIHELAQRLNMSYRHVNRILNQYYGCSFYEKLIDTKMKYAENLLIKTDMTVQKISEICDMSDTYFIRCFKRKFQFTPLQYRKSYKKDMV